MSKLINIIYIFAIIETILLFVCQIIYFSLNEKQKLNNKFFILNLIIALCCTVYYLILLFADIDGYAFRGCIIMYILFILLLIIMTAVNIYLISLFINIYKNVYIYRKIFSMSKVIKFAIIPILCIVIIAIIILFTRESLLLIKTLMWTDFFYGYIFNLLFDIVVFSFCASMAPLGYVLSFSTK